MDADVNISRSRWFTLLRQLQRRGKGDRESGAFLLAKHGSRQVHQIVYYDDLDPNCLDDGYIQFNGSGYVILSKICQSNKLRVIADVHTHPGSWTGQSQVDKEHPMMARIGHVGLIIPSFAKGNKFSLKGVNSFFYKGDGEWKNWNGHVRLTLP